MDLLLEACALSRRPDTNDWPAQAQLPRTSGDHSERHTQLICPTSSALRNSEAFGSLPGFFPLESLPPLRVVAKRLAGFSIQYHTSSGSRSGSLSPHSPFSLFSTNKGDQAFIRVRSCCFPCCRFCLPHQFFPVWPFPNGWIRLCCLVLG